MQTTLVTGGAGFIGSHLVEALLADGQHVLVLDDLSTGSIENLQRVRNDRRLELIIDSVAHEDRLAELIGRADSVYHLAATVGVRLVLEDPARTVATNVQPTETLLRLLRGRAKPLFLASTSEVYGKNPKTPLAESDDLVLGPTFKGRWIYGCSKALDEYLALSYSAQGELPVVIGRFFNVVGPRQVGQYGMVLPRFIDQALAGGPLLVYDDGRQVRCFAHVSDVLRGVLDLMGCPEAGGKVFNLGSDRPVTIQVLAEIVAKAIDPSIEIKHIPYAEAYAPGFEDIRCRVPDLTRVRQAIGYEPRFGLEQIVQELVADKRRMGHLHI